AKIKIAKATADIALPETSVAAAADYDSGKKASSKKRLVTGPIEFAVDGEDETAWGIDAGAGLRNQPRKAVFEAASPIANPGGTVLTFYLSQKHAVGSSDIADNQNLGRFRLSITTAPGAAADPLPKAVREILSIPNDQRSTAQVQTVFDYWRTTVPEWD